MLTKSQFYRFQFIIFKSQLNLQTNKNVNFGKLNYKPKLLQIEFDKLPIKSNVGFLILTSCYMVIIA